MKASIKEGCIGCGICVNACSSVFRMTDEGLAEVFEQPRLTREAETWKAANGCPVSVIIIEE